MKTKLGQILLIAVVGIIGVLSVNAQRIVDYDFARGNVLHAGDSLKPGQGLRSPGKSYAFVLQSDGNLCLYKLIKGGVETPIKCTNTTGNEDQRGTHLDMQKDGNVVLYNAKGTALWSTDTYRDGAEKKGLRLVMYDDDAAAIVLFSQREKPIYNFQKGRLY